MTRRPPTRRLHEHPDLNQLKRQAKELLGAFRAGETQAFAEVNAHYTYADPVTFALHDAQLVLARNYGFESWPKLKAYVDGVTVRRLPMPSAPMTWTRFASCSKRGRSLPAWRCRTVTSTARFTLL